MKSLTHDVSLALSHVDRRTIQFILVLISVGMLVIGAGAPLGDGGGG